VRLSPSPSRKAASPSRSKRAKSLAAGILSRARTAEVKRTDIEAVEQKAARLTYVNGARRWPSRPSSLHLWRHATRARSILQALKPAGALRAEIIVNDC